MLTKLPEPRVKREHKLSSLKQLSRLVTVLTFSSILAALFSAMPARAFIVSDLPAWVWQIINDLMKKEINIEEWAKVITDILKDPCKNDVPILFFMPTDGPWCEKNITLDSENIVENATGEMNIPNPNQTRAEIEKSTVESTAAQQPDVFEMNNVVWGVYAANDMDRDLTRLAIESVMGEAGQKQMNTTIQSVEKVVKEIGDDANKAQKLDVTQDVMKTQIKAFAQQSVLLAGIRAEASRSRVDTQFTNLNLMNASRTLDELTRSQRMESSSNAMYLIEISGQSNLQ